MTPPAGLGVSLLSSLLQMFLLLPKRRRCPCNVLRHTRHHSPRGTIMMVMCATNPTLSTMPRTQDHPTVTVPPSLVLDIRMEDRLDTLHSTGRLPFSNLVTHRFPRGPGCNNSSNCSSATWVHSAHSSATKTYTTSFDVKHCLRYSRIVLPLWLQGDVPSMDHTAWA